MQQTAQWLPLTPKGAFSLNVSSVAYLARLPPAFSRSRARYVGRLNVEMKQDERQEKKFDKRRSVNFVFHLPNGGLSVEYEKKRKLRGNSIGAAASAPDGHS
jgi:DNA-binding transcriptional LysR family regulator